MPHFVEIADPHDPRIEAFRDIRERDLVGREGLFIAEGEVVLARLLATSPERVASVLLARKRVERLKNVLTVLPDEVPVYLAGDDVLDAIAGFHLHRGILAIGRRANEIAAAALLGGLPSRAMLAVLVGIANHDNMGGIFRNAAAFGVDAILLDPTSCDPLYRKSIRVSVGAALSVPFIRLRPGEDPVALVAEFGFEPVALSPAGALELREVRRPDRVALFFGAEGPGLPASILERCRSVRIEMAPGLDSLNVATSSGIVLHHFAGGR